MDRESRVRRPLRDPGDPEASTALDAAAQVTRALPLVRAILRTMQVSERELAKAQQRARDYADRVHQLGPRVDVQALLAAVEDEISTFEADLMAQGSELEQLGGFVIDLEQGEVDFPSNLDGLPINLCWRTTEETVGHFHGEDEGCESRRPLPVPAAVDGEEF